MTKKGEKQINWTKEEKESFRNDWQFMSKHDLLKKYNRSYSTLKTTARNIGVKKAFPQNKYKLIKLVEETNISHYWQGFILGDGCVYNTYLKITLEKTDRNHLIKYCNYCGIPEPFTYNDKHYKTSVADSYVCKFLNEKYSIKHPKTYNCPDFDIKNDNLFISFLCGLIDADGCFCTDSKTKKVNMIRIHCHSSWENFYIKIKERLKNFDIEARTYMCSRGYLKFIISRQKYFIKLFDLVKQQNIPYLERKWDKLQSINC